MESFREYVLENKKKYKYVDTELLLKSKIKYEKISSGVMPSTFDITIIKNNPNIIGYESNNKDMSLLDVYEKLKNISGSNV